MLDGELINYINNWKYNKNIRQIIIKLIIAYKIIGLMFGMTPVPVTVKCKISVKYQPG